VSIFWSCFWCILGGCAVSYFFFDGLGKYEIIYLGIIGVILGLDSALSEIKNKIEGLESITSVSIQNKLDDIKSNTSNIEWIGSNVFDIEKEIKRLKEDISRISSELSIGLSGIDSGISRLELDISRIESCNCNY
jgi:archaellum component FlaC